MQDHLSRFNQLFKQMDDIYRQTARESGLSECALWILYFLRETQTPLTQRQMCGLLMQPKQSINTALKKMESDGWITLSPSSEDRRSKVLSLTQTGMAIASRTADPILRAEAAAFSRFSSKELENYLALLERHTNALQMELSSIFEGVSP